MIYQLLLCLACAVLDVLAAAGVAATEKDHEIALLRHQLHVLERKTNKAQLSRPEKLLLVALADKLKSQTQRFRDRLGECVLLVKPDTLLKWHRELVRLSQEGPILCRDILGGTLHDYYRLAA